MPAIHSNRALSRRTANLAQAVAGMSEASS